MMSPEEIQKRRDEHFALAAKRKDLIERSVAASHSGDKKLASKLFREITNLTPRMCEHDRHWSSTCIACDEIHKEVFPEYYITCSVCKEDCHKEDAHLHQGEYIGDECCWDERLRATE